MKAIHIIAFILLVVGGLNWGLYAATGWDISRFLPGEMDGTIARIVYALVGVSAIVEVATHTKTCKACKSDAMPSAMGSM